MRSKLWTKHLIHLKLFPIAFPCINLSYNYLRAGNTGEGRTALNSSDSTQGHKSIPGWSPPRSLWFCESVHFIDPLDSANYACKSITCHLKKKKKSIFYTDILGKKKRPVYQISVHSLFCLASHTDTEQTSLALALDLCCLTLLNLN